MNEAIAAIVENAASPDPKVQDEAILQLAMALEFNRFRPEFRAGKRASYEKTVPPKVLVTLEAAEESEVIRSLARLIESESFKPSMLWALGKARPSLACGTLLSVLKRKGATFDEEATWQATAALDNVLALRDPEVRGAVSAISPRPFLEMGSAFADPRIHTTAARLLNRLTTEGL